MNHLHFIRNEKGLTLVELMIVMVLSLLLMAAVYYTYLLQNKSGQVQFQVAATQQDLRAVMEMISLDVQHAGMDPTFTNSIQGIVPVDSGLTALRMRMDLLPLPTSTTPMGDGLTTATNEDITYRLIGNNLQRVDNNGGITQVLAHNVTNLNFIYRGRQVDGTIYDINPTGAGNTLTSDEADAVRYVRIR
ncbi:MAG: prepilin-type N-terminal cleavage/methylation domain-containing protein, partial [Syntrophaceae bacterium]|nr:prepilin-type N-terminal cleavage/methylation domain-containing protein [Deltaproteobacteria bacterium]